MPDNPQAMADAPFALPEQCVVSLHGRDTLAFAQAQAMNDVSLLADGAWQWNGWLTPKGRVIALFSLLRLAADTVWMLLPDAAADEFAGALRRFVFRSKVSIDVRGDLRVSGAFAAPATASGAALQRIGGESVELDFGAAGGPRTLRIAAGSVPEYAAEAERWRVFDLAHGLPRLAASQAGQWTPQQLSLERLRAFSVKKGCYPGQEIVARTHFLGQAKRGLALLRVEGDAAPGDEVRQAGQTIGTVVSSAGTSALAVLPLQREPGELAVGVHVAREAALQDGLAR
jgi:tRNA-modifying protein YgfZ